MLAGLVLCTKEIFILLNVVVYYMEVLAIVWMKCAYMKILYLIRKASC